MFIKILIVTALLIAVASLAACGEPGTPTQMLPTNQPIDPMPEVQSSILPESVTLNGVNYQAETRIQKPWSDSGDVDIAPITLRPWVTITNTGDQPAEILLEGCPLRFRVYGNASRSGTPIWDQEQSNQRMGGMYARSLCGRS